MRKGGRNQAVCAAKVEDNVEVSLLQWNNFRQTSCWTSHGSKCCPWRPFCLAMSCIECINDYLLAGDWLSLWDLMWTAVTLLIQCCHCEGTPRWSIADNEIGNHPSSCHHSHVQWQMASFTLCLPWWNGFSWNFQLFSDFSKKLVQMCELSLGQLDREPTVINMGSGKSGEKLVVAAGQDGRWGGRANKSCLSSILQIFFCWWQEERGFDATMGVTDVSFWIRLAAELWQKNHGFICSHVTLRSYSHGLITLDLQHLVTTFDKVPSNQHVRVCLSAKKKKKKKWRWRLSTLNLTSLFRVRKISSFVTGFAQ